MERSYVLSIRSVDLAFQGLSRSNGIVLLRGQARPIHQMPDFLCRNAI